MIEIDLEKADAWIAKGAKPSDKVASLIEVSCAADDAGKVIGRRGRTIKAIRTLARALGARVGCAVDVEVLG